MTGPGRGILLATILGLGPMAGAAQTCLRGAPVPRCHQFFVIEMDGYHSAGGVTSSSYVYSWAVGGMANTGHRSAVGAALLVAVDDDGYRMGLQGRFRRWLHGRTALDLTPVISRGGAAFGVALTKGDLVGVALNYQQANGSGRLYAGIRLGSWMVPVGMAGLAAAAAVTYNK